MDRNNGDFEGLLPRGDEQQEAEAEQHRAISEILDQIDKNEPLNSGQKLLLRWFIGIPAVKDLRQVEMAVSAD